MLNSGGGMLASERPKYWQSKLFTTSGTWTVPADVGCVWLDGAGGGAGGGGGYASESSGGGGGGGASAEVMANEIFPTTPGETLTITIGLGGTGGGVGTNGGLSGTTSIVGATATLVNRGTLNLTAAAGGAGATTNGGSGGNPSVSTGSSQAGGAGAGTNAAIYGGGVTAQLFASPYILYGKGRITSGGPGGGATNRGGHAPAIACYDSTVASLGSNSGGAATGNLGGGGAGGNNQFGSGGYGGAGGAVGANATGYGAGGGGGGCNAAGGNGSPGFIRIYCLSSFTI